MSLPFRSELDEIKEQVEQGLKKTEETKDPKYAVEALKRAIERAKRKNRLEERMRFSAQLLIIEYRFSLPKDAARELVEALKKYVESLRMWKDPKADDYAEAFAVIAALFEPEEVPEDAPERVKVFVKSLQDYNSFLKHKHEFLDYAKAVLTKTKVSELAEKGIVEKRLEEIEEDLKPLVTKVPKKWYFYAFTLPNGRLISIRIREDAEIDEKLQEELRSRGIDLALD